jgi:hypothetical protein
MVPTLESLRVALLESWWVLESEQRSAEKREREMALRSEMQSGPEMARQLESRSALVSDRQWEPRKGKNLEPE